MDFSNLPIEIVSYILIFLDIDYNKKITYYEKEQQHIKKIYYVPSNLCLINKRWYAAIVYSKCKGCLNGRYDILKKKCIKCGHILESKKIKRKRQAILNTFNDEHFKINFNDKDNYVNKCIDLMKKLRYS